jgi:hypothetical protein
LLRRGIQSEAATAAKKSKKSLAMLSGIVTNGVILQVLGGTMRKFKTRQPRSLPFRLFVILAGAFLLLAAFAPRANADCPACIRFYDFEGVVPTPPYEVNLDSHMPALEQGPAFRAFLNTGTDPTMAATGIFPDLSETAEAGLPLNVPPGAGANLNSLGIRRSGMNQLYIDVPFFSATGIYDVTSVSFAIAANGNGYVFASVLISSNGGATFTQIGAAQVIPNGPGAILTFSIPSGTTFGDPTTVLRLAFTGGRSNGLDLQNQIDNIQINGTVIPEPATVAGGLLGVLSLCWHQRRRLISSLRLRRT